jgi:hypothetical protein
MHIGCGSTAYSVGTVYGRKGHLYTPGDTPVTSLAITLLFTGDHPVDGAQLVTSC